MEDQIERWTCMKCRVGYRIGKAHERAERLRCSDCAKSFWVGRRLEGKHSVAVMGMEHRPS